jgi:predicted enzyme related to lactoylglutathione lyase
MAHKHHISHIEIPAKDVKASVAFYKTVFDWDIETDEEMDYSMFTAEGGTGGGFSIVSDENPVGNVLIYIDTPDLTASVAAVKANGGEVLMERYEIGDFGLMATFKDPTGNLIALYQSLTR